MRVTLTIATILAAFSAGACDGYYADGGTYYDDGPYYEPVTVPPGPPPVVNFAPDVRQAEAGIYFDSSRGEDVWYFDAWVDDPDGARDVSWVYAYVYDDYDYSGEPVQSFQLFPSGEPGGWTVEWSARATYLDPLYTGYSVEIIAEDTFGAEGAATIVPYTY
jgi:hypothetical protein